MVRQFQWNRADSRPLWLGGIGVALAVSVVASGLSEYVGVDLLGFAKSPISPIMLAIFVGILVANSIELPQEMQRGIRFCASSILKIGIVLLGIRLSLTGAGAFTLVALPFVIAAITVGLIAVSLVGRSIGMSRELSGLIAIGTSICGCTAIVATAPLVKAKESEVSYAIACITVFGLAAMFVYPLLARHYFSAQPELAGLLIGTAIHETAQVAGAGLMYETQFNAPVALDIATITKLVRNLCMILVIPLVAWLYRDNGSTEDRYRPSVRSMIPWFIVGFAMMSGVRTIGDQGENAFGILSPDQWRLIVATIREAAEWCLLVAMAAVGLSTILAGIVSIGIRPFLLGLIAATIVGGVSFLLILGFGDLALSSLGAGLAN